MLYATHIKTDLSDDSVSISPLITPSPGAKRNWSRKIPLIAGNPLEPYELQHS